MGKLLKIRKVSLFESKNVQEKANGADQYLFLFLIGSIKRIPKEHSKTKREKT
ncbi:hypothetical protein FH5_04121 [Priestia endophytica]|nr:hypothetical protein FH5_04121 [Priestia endophytica]